MKSGLSVNLEFEIPIVLERIYFSKYSYTIWLN